MPDTPNFAITYPCENVPISCNDFAVLATDTEAAILSVNAEATAVLSDPAARARASTAVALAVDTTLTYAAFPTTQFSSGITFNAAAGTFTIVTPGIYIASTAVDSNSSTLTMTSQRVSVVLNGVLYGARKYRGTNPITANVLTGSYTIAIGPLIAGDVVTFRYLWTGTGVLNANAGATVSLNYLAT